MGSGEGSKVEGIDLSDHPGRKPKCRFFKEMIIIISIPPGKFLRERFRKEFEGLEKRAENSDRLRKLPDKTQLWQKLSKAFKQGFLCPHCDERMMIKDPIKPYYYFFSPDHEVSEDRGGDNSIDNLQFICHWCNMMKGAASHERFEDLAENNRDLIKKLKREGWSSRLADKFDRKRTRA